MAYTNETGQRRRSSSGSVHDALDLSPRITSELTPSALNLFTELHIPREIARSGTVLPDPGDRDEEERQTVRPQLRAAPVPPAAADRIAPFAPIVSSLEACILDPAHHPEIAAMMTQLGLE